MCGEDGPTIGRGYENETNTVSIVKMSVASFGGGGFSGGRERGKSSYLLSIRGEQP